MRISVPVVHTTPQASNRTVLNPAIRPHRVPNEKADTTCAFTEFSPVHSPYYHYCHIQLKESSE